MSYMRDDEKLTCPIYILTANYRTKIFFVLLYPSDKFFYSSNSPLAQASLSREIYTPCKLHACTGTQCCSLVHKTHISLFI